MRLLASLLFLFSILSQPCGVTMASSTRPPSAIPMGQVSETSGNSPIEMARSLLDQARSLLDGVMNSSAQPALSSNNCSSDMAQPVFPGITIQPDTKIVFNATYDDKHPYHVKVSTESSVATPPPPPPCQDPFRVDTPRRAPFRTSRARKFAVPGPAWRRGTAS